MEIFLKNSMLSTVYMACYRHCYQISYWTSWTRNWKAATTVFADMPMTATFTSKAKRQENG